MMPGKDLVRATPRRALPPPARERAKAFDLRPERTGSSTSAQKETP